MNLECIEILEDNSKESPHPGGSYFLPRTDFYPKVPKEIIESEDPNKYNLYLI